MLASGIPVLYDERMNCNPGGRSPSGDKPGKVVGDWVERGMPVRISSDFKRASIAQLQLAHSWQYLHGVFSGRIDNGHGNNLRDVAEACRWTVGSMVAVCHAAMDHGVACSPSSGFHHAGYDWNHGFCTFNGLVIAAIEMIEDRWGGASWHSGF